MTSLRAVLPVTVFGVYLLGLTGTAAAASFTPDFSEYSFPGSQFTVDAAANAYYATNYGIDIDNAYLYRDGRDTFDGIGISVGQVSQIGTPQTGRITFLDTTDFVTIDWWSIQATIYQAYAADGTQLDSTLSVVANQTGTHTFKGGSTPIAHLTWSSVGGFGQISGLTYNYDGNTDGTNTDLPDPTAVVPEPSTLTLLASALLGVGVIRRRLRG